MNILRMLRSKAQG